MTSTQTDLKDYNYFVGNQWRKAAGNKLFEVHEPYSGELFARVASASRADALAVVDAAKSLHSGSVQHEPKRKRK